MTHPRIEFANMPGISEKAAAGLVAAGLRRLEHAKGFSVEELAKVPGVTKAVAKHIVEEVSTMSA